MLADACLVEVALGLCLFTHIRACTVGGVGHGRVTTGRCDSLFNRIRHINLLCDSLTVEDCREILPMRFYVDISIVESY